jgi:hypothetical protein
MSGESAGGHGATTGVWIAAAVIMIGTVVAGVALIEWWLGIVFWVGVGMIVVGGIAGYFANIMDMVSEYAAAPAPAEIEQH